MNPLVYIVMPCYNSEKYLLEQLMSIYYQNYTDWYLIFVNDWSTDKSEDIIRDWISHYNLHDKVKVVNKENWWVNTATWRWLEEVKGMCDINNTDSLISYCDSDDIWTRDKLKIQVEYMVSHPECDLSYTDMAIIDENWIIKDKSFLDKSLPEKAKNFYYFCILGTYIISTEMMYRAKHIDNILPIPWLTPVIYQAQDFWTISSVLLSWGNLHFINKSLVYYRKRESSLQSKLKTIDNIVRFENKIKFYYKLQERFHDNDQIGNVINFYKDRYLNRGKKEFSQSMIYFFILIKYPKIFFILTKDKLFKLFKA